MNIELEQMLYNAIGNVATGNYAEADKLLPSIMEAKLLERVREITQANKNSTNAQDGDK